MTATNIRLGLQPSSTMPHDLPPDWLQDAAPAFATSHPRRGPSSGPNVLGPVNSAYLLAQSQVPDRQKCVNLKDPSSGVIFSLIPH